MKILNFFLFILSIIGSLIIDPISLNDIKNIRTEYISHLEKLMKKPVEHLLREGYLIKDIELNKTCIDKKIIGVIDISGSYFKIGLVKLFKENDNLKYEAIKAIKIEFPEDCKSSEYWFDWTSKKIVDILSSWNYKIDTCSLIFSYPIKYEKDNEAYPTAFPKFWCFENSESKHLEIKDSLNKSIKKYIENNDKKFRKDFIDSINIKTVLNDSVATYFASKFVISDSNIKTSESNKIYKNTNIGLVLGTGTNASFLFIKDNIRYIFNTEWASFIPKNIKLLTEEKLQIEQLPKSHNYIDILCGLKYRLDLTNLIIKERNLELEPISSKEILKLLLNPDLQDDRKNLFVDLCKRSREILAALLSSIIKTVNCTEVLIIFNGSAYKIPNEINEFLKSTRRNLKELKIDNVDINTYYKEESAFIGSAYYALCHLLN